MEQSETFAAEEEGDSIHKLKTGWVSHEAEEEVLKMINRGHISGHHNLSGDTAVLGFPLIFFPRT